MVQNHTPFIQKKNRTEIRKPLAGRQDRYHALWTERDQVPQLISSFFFLMVTRVIQAVTFSSPSWRSFTQLEVTKNHPKKGTSRIARYSTNCWFGDRWFGIRIRVPLRIPIPFIFESFPEPNHQAPNHQCTIN